MKTLLVPLFLLLGLTTCKKDNTDPNGLPPATQEGKNTGGFLLNGQPWLPKIDPLNAGRSPVGAIYGPYTQRIVRLSLNFYRYENDNNSQGLSINIEKIKQGGIFQLDQNIDPFVISGPRPPYAVYTIFDPGTDRSFYTGPQGRGQVIITRLDTLARVVSGTFEAKVREDGGRDSLTITQGRFDFRF